MRILSIDSSSNSLAIAQYDHKKMLGCRWEKETNKHAEQLIGVINESLHAIDWRITDITTLLVNMGPGSFTGIRAGLATAYGIRQVTHCTLLGITSFERTLAHIALEHPERRAFPTLVTLDARREEIYAQRFDAHHNATSEPAAFPYAALSAHGTSEISQYAGSGADLAETHLPKHWQKIALTEQNPAILLAEYFFMHPSHAHSDPTPLYIRPPNTCK